MSQETLASALMWIPSVVLVVIAAIGVVAGRKRIVALVHGLETRRVFAPPRREVAGLAGPISSDVQGLKGTALAEALDELGAYARMMRPDWILGVHPGGRLVSAYVADLIGLDARHCLYVSTSRGQTEGIEILQRPNIIGGRVLIVDDAARSGQTLRAVRSYLEAANATDDFKLETVEFAVLALVVTEGDPGVRFAPHWARYTTTDYYFRFPWSQLTAKINHEYRLMVMGSPHDKKTIAEYQKIVTDFDYALKTMQGFVEPS